MSGFLSGFKPVVKKQVQKPCSNFKLRKKLPMNECTDNPLIRKSSYLTDDESFQENEMLKLDKSCEDYSTKIHDIDQIDKENIRDVESEKKMVDTVIDTVCTRLSEVNVNQKTPIKQQCSASLFGSTQKSLPDTVLNSTQHSNVLQEIEVPLSSRKQLFKNTDIDSSSSQEEVQNEEDSDNSEVINVLDSEDEEQIEVLDPPILKSSDSFVNCSSSVGTVNDFFNNPPLIPSNKAITHSMIQRFRNGEPLVARNDDDIINTSIPMEAVDDMEHVEIGPTDESDIEDNNVYDLTYDDDSGPKSKPEEIIDTSGRDSKINSKASNHTPVSVNIATQTPDESFKDIKKKKKGTNVKIQFDLKISIKDVSSSSDSHDESVNSTDKNFESHLKALPASTLFEKNSDNNASLTENSTVMGSEVSERKLDKMDTFVTPERNIDDRPVIEEDVQNILNELYGDTWKTPQLLSNFKVKKFKENLRKSLASKNFDAFIGSISKDLESTRISSPKSEKPIRKSSKSNNLLKPIIGRRIETKDNSNVKQCPSYKNLLTPEPYNIGKESDNGSKKKIGSTVKIGSTPRAKDIKLSVPKSVPKTPLHLICDPDTSDEDASEETDDDFNPDDTWNASSDEEYESEKDRIKKRQSIKHGEMVFTMDDSLNEVLKKFEFKPHPQIHPSVPEKPSRRKLFTHPNYEDEEEVQETLEIPKPKSTDDKKELKPKDLKKSPTNNKTPKSILINDPLCRKEMIKRFSKYGFLKSLDVEANRTLCDPEALVYRDNYKTKKIELTEKLFKIYNEKVFKLKLSNVPVKWNKKLQTTGGRCNNSRRNGVRNSLIELSDKVLTSADRLRCTLIHEMCHAATWILNGENGHGATWKNWTGLANSIFPELPKITVCHDYQIEYKYTYLCTKCHARSQTHSKSKKVEEIRCSLCKGSIQLFENKKNKEGKLELVPVQRKEPTAFAKFVKLKFKEVKKPHLSHKETMQILSAQFSTLSVQEKAQL